MVQKPRLAGTVSGPFPVPDFGGFRELAGVPVIFDNGSAPTSA
jgi:hypothetical protein